MGTAKRSGGLYYLNGIAVDADGKAVKDAPKRGPNTSPEEQPGSPDAPTAEERMAGAIASALRGKRDG